MERLINKLRQTQFTWVFLFAVLVVMTVLTVILVSGIKRQTAITAGVYSERSRMLFESEEKRDGLQLLLNSAGSDAATVNEAARQGMTFAGSIRFTVLNPEALEKYTEEEYQRYIEEIAKWD